MKITDIIWKEQFVEKLEIKHNVTIYEAEETLQSNPLVCKVAKGSVRGEDIYSAQAQIINGRYMIVFFIRKKHDIVLPISAREMTQTERKYYEKHK
ncbi:BrnT family toxin [candidate division KSB1 bacterium]|nr:BrnT family toxin [candidate division KSB1 bacterium]MBL7095747.1 BrnT family toxin [candidate division KSB1 bacterium]